MNDNNKRCRSDSFDSMDTNTSVDETHKKIKSTIFHVATVQYKGENITATGMSRQMAIDNLAERLSTLMCEVRTSIPAEEFLKNHKLLHSLHHDEYHTCPGLYCNVLIPLERQLCGDFTCYTEDAHNNETAVLVKKPPCGDTIDDIDCDVPPVKTPPCLTIPIPRYVEVTVRLPPIRKFQAIVRGVLVRKKMKKGTSDKKKNQ